MTAVSLTPIRAIKLILESCFYDKPYYTCLSIHDRLTLSTKINVICGL